MPTTSDTQAREQVIRQVKAKIAVYEDVIASAEAEIKAAQSRQARARADLVKAATTLDFLNLDHEVEPGETSAASTVESQIHAPTVVPPASTGQAPEATNGHRPRLQTIDVAVAVLQRHEAEHGDVTPVSYAAIAREAIAAGFQTTAKQPEYNFITALRRETDKPNPRVKKVGSKWALSHWPKVAP